MLAALVGVLLVQATVRAQSTPGPSESPVASQQQSQSAQSSQSAPPDSSKVSAPQYEVRWLRTETPQPPQTVEKTQWYGWQNLLSDVTSSVLFAQNGSSHGVAPLQYIGIAGYVAGSPLIHGANGCWNNALLSAALRLGLPTLGGLTGMALTKPDSQSDDSDISRALAIGGGIIVGALAAMLVDDIFVARKTTQVPRTAAITRPALRLSPIISRDVRGISLALSL